jgi:UDP-glucuronate 4-epimerase
MQPGDVPVTCADTTRLRQLVDFEPDTPLAEGLTRFCDWYLTWSGLSGSAAGISAAGWQQ